MDVYLYETTAKTDAATSEPVRMSYGPGYNHPSAPGYYAPVVMDNEIGAVFTRSIYPERLAFGLGRIDPGIVSFAAIDGAWDWLDEAGFGQPAKLLLGDENDAYEDFEVIATGIASNALIGVETGEIGWQDKTKNLDLPVSDGLYAGTNDGATGLEGTQDDIGGQRKQRTWGVMDDLVPTLLNGSQRIYGWNFDRTGSRVATHALRAVRVRGAATWVPHTTPDYADAASLVAASLTSGVYATCLAESLIKFGGSNSIDGAVRLDVTIGATDAANYAGAIVRTILEDIGETVSTINITELEALDAERPFVVGYTTQDETARDVCNAFLRSVLAWCVPDQLGVYRFGFVPTAVGSAVASLKEFSVGIYAGDNDVNIVSMRPVPITDGKGVPTKTVRVRFGRRWGYQDVSALATGLTDEEKKKYSTEWRVTDAVTDAGIALQYANADEITFDTLVHSRVDAEAIRGALASIVNRKVRRYDIDIQATPATVSKFRPGVLVDVYHRRFNMTTGYQCFVTYTKSDVRAGSIALQVLGVG